jgi:hypothetical protein
VSKAIFILGVWVVLIILSGCSSQAPLCQSRWQDKPVKVDGKLTEWPVPLDFIDNGTKLNYVISNDDSNLYYWIRITDDKEQIRIMRAGMHFWIDTTGKNQQQVGIQFPFAQYTGATDKQGKGHNASADSALLKADSKKWTGKLDQMRLTGFKYPIAGMVPIPNTYGIKIAIARDSSGVTLYEACIPFKTFYKPCLTAADNNRQIGITMIINPMPGAGEHSAEHHAHAEGGSGGGGFGGPGGMANMGGGGFGGGMGGGGMHGGGRRGGSQSSDDDEQSYLKSAVLKMALRLTVK